MGQRTLARPAAWIMVGLVAYASLFPFTGWRTQDSEFLGFLWAPWPRYWTGFDVLGNLLGYMPLGFFCAVAVLRTEGGHWRWVGAALFPSVFSLCMEALQVYLPSRVPSNVDWLLNTAGGWLGVLLSWSSHRVGLLDWWQRLRANWFVPEAHGALLLLALWPLALLYPLSVPFGMGQVWSRVDRAVQAVFEETAFAHWWPAADIVWAPLSPLAEAWCVALFILAPALLGYSVLMGWMRRLVHLVAVGVLGGVMSAFSSAMTYGPVHAWVWLTPTVVSGAVMGLLAGLLMLGLSRRACAVWMLLTVTVALTLLNRSAPTPYLAESLDVWAQGRFIRFHGVTQWLGWLWPYAVLWHGIGQATRRSGRHGFDATTQA